MRGFSHTAYLVVVSQDPAQTVRVLLSKTRFELCVLARDAKLVVIVTVLPAILPQADVVVRLTVTVICEGVRVGGW